MLPMPENPPRTAGPGCVEWFDSHNHLQDERLAPHREAVLERASNAGVTGMLCCGSAESDWATVRDLARSLPAVIPAFGLHPWYATDRSPAWLESLRDLLRDPSAGVGEIGLDRALDPATFPAQEEVFLAQVRLAAELHRPVSLHCRRAWGRLMELLDRQGWPPDGVVLHSYSGGAELVTPLVRRGAFFSFSGAITHGANRRGREAIPVIPADRLLIETDAPDIPAALPVDLPVLRGADGRFLSEPAHLVHVAAAVAALRGQSPAEVAALTTRNARQLLSAGRAPTTTSGGSECRPRSTRA